MTGWPRWLSLSRHPSPSAILFGRYWNMETERVGRSLRYEGERYVLLLGPKRSGKLTHILAINLLDLENCSLVMIVSLVPLL